MYQKLLKVISVILSLALGVGIGFLVFDDGSDYVEVKPEPEIEVEDDTVEVREASTELIDSINAYLNENGIDQSQIAICIRSLDKQEDYNINGDTEFIAASVYKLPLAVLWYEKVNNGEVSLQDTLVYDASYYEAGPGVASDYAAGSNIPLSELLDSLILKSDNTAGHILFENLGGWANFKQEITKYTTREMDAEFFSYENVLTANYTADVLQYIYDHQENFETLISNMRQSRDNDYLDLKIDTNVAQKYGSYSYYENAAGFVDSAKIPYSISVFTTLGSNGVQVIGDLNEIAYNYFNK